MILCECERLDCLERLALPAEVYGETRADRERFVVIAGHEDPGVERLVANDGYCIVRVPPPVRGELAPNPLPTA